MAISSGDEARCRDAIQGLESGDFSRLEPLFQGNLASSGDRPEIIEWYEQGGFANEPGALAEALTCACFLGKAGIAEYLLTRGLNPSGGFGTGLNALHWAANRGQLEAVRLLLGHQVPLETRNMYGGSALGTAVWSAVHEPRGNQLEIIEELLKAGARLDDAEYPSGNPAVDATLRKHGA